MPASYAASSGVYTYWRRLGQRRGAPSAPPSDSLAAAAAAEVAGEEEPSQAAATAEDTEAVAGRPLLGDPERLRSYLAALERPLAGPGAADAAAPPANSAGGSSGAVDAAPLLPVFRAAPYAAELARQRQHQNTVRILFLDEGG